MNKVAHYLQEHIAGEVMTGADARKYFSTDTSIFALTPAMIVYPRTESDVRKTARFTWQLAERGRVIPITARGLGTDQSGAALGEGILLVFPAHMNRVLELDGKTGSVTVEPGINYGKLQQTLHSHHRFLPPFPSSLEYSTVGGAIANNASGEKTVKYGNTREYVKSLRIVLANGEVIETKRISKRELSKKLGMATFEGEIYRSIDALLDESGHILKEFNLRVTKNSAGYALSEVKRKDGSFDLTPLIVGSQGTLAIVTEATLDTVPHNPDTTLIAALVEDLQVAQELIADLRKLPEIPSAIEIVDDKLLNFVHHYNPNQLKGILDPPFSKLVVLIEFDNHNERTQKRMTKKTTKILQKYQIPYRLENEAQKKEELWQIRHSAASIVAYSEGGSKALPIIEDGIVPQDKFKEYIDAVYALFERHGLRAAFWGHGGDANLHMQPLLDLGQVGDRQKVFKLMDEYYRIVIEMGGSITGEHGDGRLRGPYVRALFGNEIYEVFRKVKNAFDPYGTLNPGVKIDVTQETNKPLLRQDYDIQHLYNHMPRS